VRVQSEWRIGEICSPRSSDTQVCEVTGSLKSFYIGLILIAQRYTENVILLRNFILS
jgi:hypothetical protein